MRWNAANVRLLARPGGMSARTAYRWNPETARIAEISRICSVATSQNNRNKFSN